MALNRRQFLKHTALAGASGYVLPQFANLGPLSTAAVTRPAGSASLMDRIAQILIDTDADAIFDPLAKEIRNGASLIDLMGGVLLAGVKEINPRPVGFKLHAVMMVGSALDLAREADPHDRWLPAFWNAYDFKRSQRQDSRYGDWVMGELPKVPGTNAQTAQATFSDVMDAWEEDAADAAAVALYPHLDQADFFELLWLPAARCFSNLGHKIIYTAQAFRALEHLGWQHCGLPLIRSLVHALLEDKPGRRIGVYKTNRMLAGQFPRNWANGKDDPSQSAALAEFLHRASPEDASAHVLELVRKGLGQQTIWDGFRLAAADFLFRDPSLLSVHPLTSLNALRIGFQATRNPETQKVLLLQAASFIAFYRRDLGSMRGIDFQTRGLWDLKPKPTAKSMSLNEVFDMTVGDTEAGQRALLGTFNGTGVEPEAFKRVRANLFQMASEHHQYKYTAAMFQECRACHPRWAAYLFAGGLGYLPHQGGLPSLVYRETRRVTKGI